jgi:pilus assembly protein Flp/PilA
MGDNFDSGTREKPPLTGTRGKEIMTRITNLALRLKIWKDTRGQDLIEYALMAGFVAVAAGAIMPGVATSISTIFSKIASVMTAASSTS